MKGINLLLTKWINSFFEFANEKPIPEINSLNYDNGNNKLVIGVTGGFWVISENLVTGEVKGVFYEE